MQDSLSAYLASIEKLRRNEEPFALATVVKVHGSASARVGSKAIFDKNGKNIFGWIGGGCAERFVGEQSVESLKEKKGRVVLADLDDEIFGLGVACGGKMEIFIDPITLREELSLPMTIQYKSPLDDITHAYDFKLQWQETVKDFENIGDVFLELALKLARQRGRSGLSLRQVKDLPFQFGTMNPATAQTAVALIGHGRIVDALEKHFQLLGWKVRIVGPEEQHHVTYASGECVVIAGHSSQDPQKVKLALDSNCGYVAMIGSRKRALEVIQFLDLKENSQLPLFVPTGLDIDAKNPDEIALSVVAEILLQMKGPEWT